jgi:acyl-CoA hydrolase
MSEQSREPRRAPEVVMTDIVFPGDANTFGTMFGGKAMAMMDKAAVLAGIRFARCSFITVSSDGIQFLAPVQVGDIIEMRSKVVWVGRTSLIVKVEMYREHRYSDNAPELATRDLFALAARDREGKSCELPPLLVWSEQEKEDWEEAVRFREYSLKSKTGKR